MCYTNQMFDFLTQKFSSIFTGLLNQKTITVANIDETLQKVREALLDADVPYEIVQEFSKQVQADVLGKKLEKSLKPGEQLAKLVHDRLQTFMGGVVTPVSFQIPSVIMLVGLQGSGKTTTAAKIANYINQMAQKRGKSRKILLGSVDFYRPAAIDQLEILAKQIGVDFYRANQTEPVLAAQEIYQKYKTSGYEHLILDTAGRLHIDNQMLLELTKIDQELSPKYKILVLDAMTGQESLKIAQAFDQAVGITSAVLSKIDSETRGGVAFAFSYAVKKPVSFVGVGEKVADLEQFYPDRMAQRILGMGDLQSLIERAEDKISQAEQSRLESSMAQGKFSLQDFADQMAMMSKMGSLTKIMGYMPGLGAKLTPEQLKEGEQEMRKVQAIIGSMTVKERQNHKLLDASRIARIARGAGVKTTDIAIMLKKFEQSQQFVKLLKQSGNLGKLNSWFK